MEKLLAEDTLEGKDGTQFAIRLSLASLVGGSRSDNFRNSRNRLGRCS
jgi:hypothetical protein